MNTQSQEISYPLNPHFVVVIIKWLTLRVLRAKYFLNAQNKDSNKC